MNYTTEELRAMLAGITPGPWKDDGSAFTMATWVKAGAKRVCTMRACDQDAINARAIAATPDLLAECAALREQNAKLRKALDECSSYAALLIPSKGSNDAAKRDHIIAIARAALADKGAE